MGSKAVEKFRSLHPSHHLLLSSLSMRLSAVERKGNKRRKTYNQLKIANSRLAVEEDLMEDRSKKNQKTYDRLTCQKENGKQRGRKTVRWSQQLIKVNIENFQKE